MDWSEDLGRYRRWLETKGWSAASMKGATKALQRFFLYAWRTWGDALRTPADVTKPMIEAYQESMALEASPYSRKKLAASSVANYLQAVKSFYAWMEKDGRVLVSPAADLDVFRDKRQRVGRILTEEEVVRLIEAPNVSLPLGMRDRAILELLYSTGLRLNELVALTIHDVDAAAGVVHVRAGKGKKDRVVPLGKTAAHYVGEYVVHVRSRYAKKKREASSVLFISRDGEPMTGKTVQKVVYKAARDVGLKASPHAIRRSTATHLLASGAEPELVQDLLGHSSGHSLRFYARLFGPELKEEHERTHPREQEEDEREDADEDLDESLDEDLGDEEDVA